MFGGVKFVDRRFECDWGGWNAVEAEIQLLKEASRNKYDRYVFLQGADYPVKSAEEIDRFFCNNVATEFIRACCVTGIDDKYFYNKCRYILFFNNKTVAKKIWNYAVRKLSLKMRDGYIHCKRGNLKVYWGSAQWALTHECVEYILGIYDGDNDFNRWFRYAFPADELYFATVVYNSEFAKRTQMKGAELPQKGLSNWRNLHYFEYLPGEIKVFTHSDIDSIRNLKELFIRKVNTAESEKLLDYIDKNLLHI